MAGAAGGRASGGLSTEGGCPTRAVVRPGAPAGPAEKGAGFSGYRSPGRTRDDGGGGGGRVALRALSLISSSVRVIERGSMRPRTSSSSVFLSGGWGVAAA